ncbi:hypothetical protein FB45DRAFT_1050837 [Roridomyces roridus]|uniref:Uncharacterized protein n=1 Tax=Roridomyces roridus TaxID=1738132 RepID=A0AAD7CKQ5_9AGAR|nr:hypothetical protein FB45DRAFT_1050837 [Roridomyces roridus]
MASSATSFSSLAAAAHTAVKTLPRHPYDFDVLPVLKMDVATLEFRTLSVSGRAALQARIFYALDHEFGPGTVDIDAVMLPLVDIIVAEFEAKYLEEEEENNKVSFLLPVLGKMNHGDPKRVGKWLGGSIGAVASALGKTIPRVSDIVMEDHPTPSPTTADAIFAKFVVKA